MYCPEGGDTSYAQGKGKIAAMVKRQEKRPELIIDRGGGEDSDEEPSLQENGRVARGEGCPTIALQ